MNDSVLSKNTIRSLGLGLALFSAVGLAACDSGDEAPEGQGAGSQPKTAPPVEATRVEIATLEATETELRIVRPGEIAGGKVADVAASIGGLVEKVKVDVGDEVKKGDVLARVDTRLMAAQSRLSRVEIKDAKREHERLEKLGKTVASSRVDAAETRLERAKAQHSLNQIQASRSVIKAPFDGVISDAPYEPGESIPPGAAIVRLVQLDPVKVSVAVADRDVGALAVGDVAKVSTARVADPVEGKIARIDPVADPRTRTFTVEVEVDNGADLFSPGAIATVSFQGSRARESVVIPQDFLVTKLDENGIFVAVEREGNTVAEWRPLELGEVVGDEVEVRGGVVPGEKVITVGHRTLIDGENLIISREGVCCTEGRVRYDNNAVAKAARPAAPPAEADANEPAEKQDEGDQ